MAVLAKLITGGGPRRSRLHDEKGNLIPFGRLLAHGPRALIGRAASAWGRRPELPWISYSAIRRIARLLPPGARVVEFGSGMSTLWFARRCALVVSHEDSPEWHARVQAMLDGRGLRNVELRLLTDAAAYAALDDHPEGTFDLALVDGGLARDRCVETALRRVRPGGHVYLDNSDKESDPARIDPARALGMRRAESTLLEEVARRGGTAEHFVDFVPAQCFVSQGLLCRL